MFDLYLITPELPARALVERTRAALSSAPPGRIALQLRVRQLGPDALRALGAELRALTRERGARLIVNAGLGLGLARELDADGVQLPERGPSPAEARAALPDGALVGASRHDLAGMRAAAAQGAGFVTLSPVFAVPDKGAPLGIGGFAAIARASAVPVFALGGVSERHAAALVQAGAHGVAVIREVFDSASPGRAVARLLAALDAGRDQPPRP